MICPNCREMTIKTTKTDPQTFYYDPKHHVKSKHKCTRCFASFENFDDGQEERDRIKATEQHERAMLEELVKKYGIPDDLINREIRQMKAGLKAIEDM